MRIWRFGAAGSQPDEAAGPEEDPLNAQQARHYARVRELVRRALGRFSRLGDLDTLYDPSGRDVLDYGWAGDGDRAIALVARGAASVVGFDLWWSEDDLARVRELMRGAGVEQSVDLRLADPYAMPFADDSFDIVIGASILHPSSWTGRSPRSAACCGPAGAACSSSRSPTIH